MDRLRLALCLGATVVGISLGIPFFGMMVHEMSHAAVALLLGLRLISFSWNQIVCEMSPNPLINTLVGLAGGFGQALFAMVPFLWFYHSVMKIERTVDWKRILENKRSLVVSVLFGFEVAFLTIVLHGIINGIVEGFAHSFYLETSSNMVLWGTIFIVCGTVSFYILGRHQSRLLR